MYNRISRYMYCFYSEESNQFKKTYNSLQKVSLYINDHVYIQNTGALYNTHIFVLVDVDKTYDFDKSLDFFRMHESYEDDYEVDYNLHMIVFKLRPDFVKSLRKFKSSKYSLMYDEDYIEKYFSGSSKYCIKYRGKALDIESCAEVYNNNIPMEEIFKDLTVSPYAVLTKSDELRNMLSVLYDTTIPKSVELDSAIQGKHEIYRYSEALVMENND